MEVKQYCTGINPSDLVYFDIDVTCLKQDWERFLLNVVFDGRQTRSNWNLNSNDAFENAEIQM